MKKTQLQASTANPQQRNGFKYPEGEPGATDPSIKLCPNPDGKIMFWMERASALNSLPPVTLLPLPYAATSFLYYQKWLGFLFPPP